MLKYRSTKSAHGYDWTSGLVPDKPVTPWVRVRCCLGYRNPNPYPYPCVPVTGLSRCYPYPCHSLPPAEREETMTRSNVDNTSEDLQPSDSNIKPQDNMLSSMPATTRTLFWFSIHDNTQCFNIRRHNFSATNGQLECYVS